jgi:4-amino-4-deoxy-L-arabinose transferase
MARYALDAAKAGAKALRINGLINLVFGLVGLIAVLVVSPWGVMHKPVWTRLSCINVCWRRLRLPSGR